MFGLDGTPPGVLTLTASLRVPSPLRVRAATCSETNKYFKGQNKFKASKQINFKGILS
jgi:hypothetical protein